MTVGVNVGHLEFETGGRAEELDAVEGVLICKVSWTRVRLHTLLLVRCDSGRWCCIPPPTAIDGGGGQVSRSQLDGEPRRCARHRNRNHRPRRQNVRLSPLSIPRPLFSRPRTN